MDAPSQSAALQTATPTSSPTAYTLIDADTHLTEAHDLWTSRAPAAFRNRVPQVREIEGRASWVIDGDKVIGRGAQPASAMLRDGTKVRHLGVFRSLTIDRVHPGSYSVPDRLRFMDDHGIWAQIVYPNILGFGGQNSAKVDPELRLVAVQLYNDALADIQFASGGRICGMALLPWWDAQAAAREIRRALDLGLKGININSAPHNHPGIDGQRLPDLSSPYWDPMWDICDATRLPINFHIGSSEQSVDWMGNQGWPSLCENYAGAVGGAMLFFNNGQTLANIIYSGLLDRYENLQFVSVESGIGWIPFMLESLDYQYLEIAEAKGLKRRPSEYFPTNFHGMFWFEKHNIATSLRQVGIDNCMFQTDFPHPTSLYPIDDIEARLAGLTATEKAKVMHDNCAKLYGIAPPPAWRPLSG